MSMAFYEVSENHLEIHKDSPPFCRDCGKRLEVGDRIDGHHPWYTENNQCQDCINGGVREQKAIEWNEKIKTAQPTENKLEMWLAKDLVTSLHFEQETMKGYGVKERIGANAYSFGYHSGLLRKTMTYIALSNISEQAWQAAGLTYEDMMACCFEIIG